MTKRDDLIEYALRLAREHFDESAAALAAEADGDIEALTDAANSLTKGRTSAGEPEHVAVSYLSAAFQRTVAARDQVT
jgi:hypothetical protein